MSPIIAPINLISPDNDFVGNLRPDFRVRSVPSQKKRFDLQVFVINGQYRLLISDVSASNVSSQ